MIFEYTHCVRVKEIGFQSGVKEWSFNVFMTTWWPEVEKGVKTETKIKGRTTLLFTPFTWSQAHAFKS